MLPPTNYVSALVSAISSDVVAGLALLGLPPLTDGAILLGSANVAQQGAPPRVVFEPIALRFGDADRSTISTSSLAPDFLAAWAMRPLATAFVKFRAHVWGIGDPTPGSVQNPIADIDATDALLRQVLRSCLRIAPGIGAYSSGIYANSSRSGDALLAVNGWYASFDVELATPITDYPLDLANASLPDPSQPVGYQLATYIQPADGSPPEAGPVIENPIP